MCEVTAEIVLQSGERVEIPEEFACDMRRPFPGEVLELDGRRYRTMNTIQSFGENSIHLKIRCVEVS